MFSAGKCEAVGPSGRSARCRWHSWSCCTIAERETKVLQATRHGGAAAQGGNGSHLRTCSAPEGTRWLSRIGRHRRPWLSSHTSEVLVQSRSGQCGLGIEPGTFRLHTAHLWCIPEDCVWCSWLSSELVHFTQERLRLCSFPNAIVSRGRRGTGVPWLALTFGNGPSMCNSENQVGSLGNWGVGIYHHSPDWGICNLDSKRGFLFKGQTVLGSVYVPCISCAICFNPSTKKLWNMRRKKKPSLQMSSFQAVEIILPLMGVKFCFLSVKNARSCVTWDCHPCGAGSLWCSIILQYGSYIHKSHSETYEQCYEVSGGKKNLIF